MGTLNYTVTGYGRAGGNMGTGNIVGTAYRVSAAYTTSGTASFIQSGGSDVVVQADELLVLTPTVAMWMRNDGTAATVGGGHYLPASETRVFEASTANKVSVIDA